MSYETFSGTAETVEPFEGLTARQRYVRDGHQSQADKRFRQNHLVELREKQRTEAATRRASDREPSRRAARDSAARHPMAIIFRSARWRANKHKIEFNITLDDLTPLRVEICPVFHTPLEYGAQGKGYNNLNAASLDRIDNDRGYVRGNIVIMSRRANSIKNDGTADEHRMIAEWMESVS
jgi:hypothetical protein